MQCSQPRTQHPRHLQPALTTLSPCLCWPPHCVDWLRSQLMCTLSPLVACIRLVRVKGNLQQRLEAKLLIQRFPHGRRLQPAFQIELVGTHNTHVHQQTSDTPEPMSRIHSHPVECWLPCQRLAKDIAPTVSAWLIGNGAHQQRKRMLHSQQWGRAIQFARGLYT